MEQDFGSGSSSGEAWESDIGEFLMVAKQNGHKVQNSVDNGDD